MSARLFIAFAVVLMVLAAGCAAQAPAAAPTETLAPNAAGTPGELPAAAPLTPTASARSVDRATGEAAPDFELTLFDGETLRLSDLRGKVVVLNFWASYCPPCRWEMPAFERIWQEYKDRGVVFVGVGGVLDSKEDALAFADKVGITYPLGSGATGEIARAYRITSLPTTFIIDREGNEARKFGAANEVVLRLFLKGQLGGG